MTAQSQVNSPAKGFVSSSMSVPCMSSLTLHEDSEATDCSQKLIGPRIRTLLCKSPLRRRRISDARLCPAAVLTMASWRKRSSVKLIFNCRIFLLRFRRLGGLHSKRVEFNNVARVAT